MLYFKIIFLISAVFAKNNCNTYKSKIKAAWKLVENGIEIQFSNKQLTTNQWSGIIFGTCSASSSVIIFENINEQVVVETGVMNGSTDQTLDTTSQATVLFSNISGEQLNALVTLPLSFNGIDLTACNTWSFIMTGIMENGRIGPTFSKPKTVENICPSQCT